MKKKAWKKLLALLTAVALCVCVFPGNSARAAGDALPLSTVEKLLNAEELHPQRTGYAAIDGMLEKIDAPNRGNDTYTRIKAMYDWSVNNISYSWAGYSQNWAPAYDCFTLKYDLAYETGLPEAYPLDMIYRTYHMLTARTGVCYDWGILFAVMARYVGLESYVHTGILRIGDWTGHHGWTELKLGGASYIFDAQQDNRSKGLHGGILHDHFGIAPASAGRYTQETAANAARDASLLPVTAERIRVARLTVEASRSGTVAGAGTHPWGSQVTLSAQGEVPVAGWYTPSGELLGEEQEFSLLLDGDTKVLALFEGDLFVDILEGWYLADVEEAVERGLLYGVTECSFAPKAAMNRAMLAALLARAEGADLSEVEPCPFTDVDQTKWYAKAVNWAYANGLVHGVRETKFDPLGKVTREQAAAMIVRFLNRKEVPTAAENLRASFSDVDNVSAYAFDDLCIAKGSGILSGYHDGTIRPKAAVTRAEGTAMLMRMVRYLEAA